MPAFPPWWGEYTALAHYRNNISCFTLIFPPKCTKKYLLLCLSALGMMVKGITAVAGCTPPPTAPRSPLPHHCVAAVACVVHLAPREVLALPEYRHWTGSFHAQATHFLVAESQGSAVPIMDKSTHLHARLSQIDEELFSFPPGVLAASTAAAAARAEAAAGADPPRDAEGGVLTGDNMLRYWLRPVAKRGVDRGEQQG